MAQRRPQKHDLDDGLIRRFARRSSPHTLPYMDPPLALRCMQWGRGASPFDHNTFAFHIFHASMLKSLVQGRQLFQRGTLPVLVMIIPESWNLQPSHQNVILRHISEEQINADGATVAELFEQNMAKASRRRPASEASSSEPPRLLTTRREALHLYREIMRYSNLFVWKDDKGVAWRDILR